MLAAHVIPVVLDLPAIYNAVLRQVGGRTNAKAGSGLEADVGESLPELARTRLQGIEAAAELEVIASVADAGFIHHMGAERVGPAYQRSLAQSWAISYPAASAVIAEVKAIVPVEQVTQ